MLISYKKSIPSAQLEAKLLHEPSGLQIAAGDLGTGGCVVHSHTFDKMRHVSLDEQQTCEAGSL